MTRSALAADTVNIHGTVRDGRSGTAIANAVVSGRDAGGREFRLVSDSRGRFSVVGIAAGRVALDVPAFDAYDTEELRCDLSSGVDGRLDLYLWPPAKTERENVHPDDRSSHCRLEPPTSDLYIIR